MPESTTDATTDVSLAALAEQLQALTVEVQALREETAYVAEQARRGERRQREWDELKADATPVVNDLYLATVEQLEELEPHVQAEDMLRLLKRLARKVIRLDRRACSGQ